MLVAGLLNFGCSFCVICFSWFLFVGCGLRCTWGGLCLDFLRACCVWLVACWFIGFPMLRGARVAWLRVLGFVMLWSCGRLVCLLLAVWAACLLLCLAVC